jgi:hypothetical protein
VLGDIGLGTGVAEAIDWCIHNRARDWGAGGAYQGIDVINLSLSSPDESDGNDVAAMIAARAVAMGITVVASMGNSGMPALVPSPAAGDGVIAVGAYDPQRTPRAGDDQFASFSNQGPRAGDGDADATDEMKPDLVAPGVAVLSADGDLASDGTRYQRLSGTSMAAAMVSGAVAELLSEFPSLTPGAIAAVLRATARRGLAGVPSGPAGPDPRWQAAIGWGALDLYAARLELLQSERSQVRRLALEATDTQITATLWTQRERGAAHFAIERAPDVGGLAGAFAPLDSAAAVGESSLAVTNLTPYAFTWTVPPSERGVPFWYRVSCTEGGQRYDSPARRFTSPLGGSAAEIEVRIVHDAYDHDVAAEVKVGGSTDMLWRGPTAQGQTPLTFTLPGSSDAVSSDWVSGTSATGTVAWNFVIPVPLGVADAYFPPSSSQPWSLAVSDGGYANRSGRVERFHMLWHGPDGDHEYDGVPLPMQTLEGQTVFAVIPNGTVSVGPSPSGPQFRAAPSPVRAGGLVTFVAAGRDPGEARVFDLAGRVVGRAPFVPEGDHWVARWHTSGVDGSAAAGVYFARAASATARIVVLGH